MIPFAATLLVLREAPSGLEVLMVQRSATTRFMPLAWVFPGGRVDPEDYAVPSDAIDVHACSDLPELDARDLRALGVAAIRETWEEAQIWVGSARQPRYGLADLHPWARWVTPEGESRRYDTMFFVTRAPEGLDVSIEVGEVVNIGWFAPSKALAMSAKDMPLAPPTWWTLRELADLGSVDAVFSAVPARDLRAVRPVRIQHDGHFAIALPGDLRHPDTARRGLPSCVAWDGESWALR